jgi:hypothetical protein
MNDVSLWALLNVQEVPMPSAFYQMFQFDKNTQAELAKILSTEKLAWAIRSDARSIALLN